KASLSDLDQAKVVEATQLLQKAQLTPDSPEALATIPALSVKDLPKTNQIIPEKVDLKELITLAHEQPTQGIAYTKLLLPLDGVPLRLIPLIPMFMRSLTEIGTAKHDFVSFGTEMAAKTGGIQAGVFVGSKIPTQESFAYFTLAGKAVYEKLPHLFSLWREILLEPLTDKKVAIERIGQMLLEARARLEQGMQTAGHAVVSCRLAARYTPVGSFSEETSGVSYLESIRHYLEDFAKNPDNLLSDLEEIRHALITKAPKALFSCTAENEALDNILTSARKLYQELPTLKDKETYALVCKEGLPSHEALITPSRINFVGKSVNLYQHGWKFHGSASVILRYMRMGYLWEHVRVRGGAYGAFCNLDRTSGTLICSSFRDPNHAETLKAYDQMADFLASFTLDHNQLTQAIVGAVGDLDAYILPSARGNKALSHYLLDDSETLRQELRDQMLSTTAQDFKNFAEVMANLREGDVCILGGQDLSSYAKEQGWTVKHIF
ncbi:MAG: peptidase M16, partial [Desulfovibrionaceae bacterium]|nr:peptidase M16 [Desulfovibrionaceae bacterium]